MNDVLDVRSELRGSHWVAWVVRRGESQPADGVLVVGGTREEAEQRARERQDQRREP